MSTRALGGSPLATSARHRLRGFTSRCTAAIALLCLTGLAWASTNAGSAPTPMWIGIAIGAVIVAVLILLGLFMITDSDPNFGPLLFVGLGLLLVGAPSVVSSLLKNTAATEVSRSAPLRVADPVAVERDDMSATPKPPAANGTLTRADISALESNPIFKAMMWALFAMFATGVLTAFVLWLRSLILGDHVPSPSTRFEREVGEELDALGYHRATDAGVPQLRGVPTRPYPQGESDPDDVPQITGSPSADEPPDSGPRTQHPPRRGRRILH